MGPKPVRVGVGLNQLETPPAGGLARDGTPNHGKSVEADWIRCEVARSGKPPYRINPAVRAGAATKR